MKCLVLTEIPWVICRTTSICGAFMESSRDWTGRVINRTFHVTLSRSHIVELLESVVDELCSFRSIIFHIIDLLVKNLVIWVTEVADWFQSDGNILELPLQYKNEYYLINTWDFEGGCNHMVRDEVKHFFLCTVELSSYLWRN